MTQYQRQIAALIAQVPRGARFYMAYRGPGGLMILVYEREDYA